MHTSSSSDLLRQPAPQGIAIVCEAVRRNPEARHSAASLARLAGMSLSHLQHSFKQSTGLTVRAFVEAERMRHFRQNLRAGSKVLSSAMASGIGSSRGIHARSERHLGMTPQQYRAGARGLHISYASFATPLGLILLAATDRGLCFIHFGEAEEPLVQALRREFPHATLQPALDSAREQLTVWSAALNAYLRREIPLPSLPVHVRATAFQQRVWQFLQSIPEGETRTYTEVAAGIGTPRAVRAVASACAANNVALLIPCHRVLRQGGALSGYRWGVERKRALLDGEAGKANMPSS